MIWKGIHKVPSSIEKCANGRLKNEIFFWRNKNINMEVIGFGIGNIARNAYSYISENYKILWYVDNNNSKWGEKIGDYEIKDPISILSKKVNIIVFSRNYEIEIVNQLIEMGVDSNRIYLCNQEISEGNYIYDVYPYDKKILKKVNRPLIKYDLKKQSEYMTNKVKVMIFVSFYSVYTKQLIEKMISKYENIEISLLTCARESGYLITAKDIKHIYIFESMAELENIIAQLPKYDVAQLLWIENRWVYFQDMIREKFVKLNLCVGGSDFYRASDCNREYKKKLIYSADCVSAETEVTIQNFKNYYGDNLRVKLVPFGVEVLEYINLFSGIPIDEFKSKYNIPLNKVVVTCGHNANPKHQHLELISLLNQLDNRIKENSVFVFPMTYPIGMDMHINEVRKTLEKSDLTYVILTKFMDFKDMAEYALLSDVMIHVQTTDQLSSTMLEEMYAGSIVIAGEWLPYSSLHEKGMYFIDVNNVEDVINTLIDVINNLEQYREKCKVNKELVWKHSSWDVLCEKWYELWV